MLVGREREVQVLECHLGKSTSGAPLVPAIFVYGQAGTGKTLTILRVLENLADLHVTAVVNCVETYSSRVLFAEVLLQIDRNLHFSQEGKEVEEEEEEEDLEEKTTCRFSVNDFVSQLRLRVSALTKQRCLCLFFDQAERLRDLQPHLLDVLTRLHELCDGRVVSVFASRIPWEKFPCGAFAGVEPIVLHFGNYSREQLAVILKANARQEAADTLEKFTGNKERLLSQFTDLLLDVLSAACRDAGELSFLARANIASYLEPLLRDDCAVSCTDEIGLWRRFEPQLRSMMQSVFLRHEEGEKRPLELPFFTKFLLLAAYMASYNPKSADKKFLVKNTALTGRMTSRGKHCAKRAERTKNHLLGPKPFPLDRWMAIFYAIIEDRIPHSVGIVSQVPTLVSLNLVSQVGGEDCLSKPKYKCLIPLEMAREIANSVNFDLLSFLLDFC